MGSKNKNSFRVRDIMTFRPTFEEFKDFNKYIEYMESQGAHEAGLAKVIPPPEWKPRTGSFDMSEIGDLKIPAPISQILNGVGGTYQQINLQKKPTTVREYKTLAESMKYCKYRPPLIGDNEEVERAYWKHILYGEQIYGADVSGSLMDPDLKEWNINKLGSILDYVSEDYKIAIEGVNTAYLYFGMWKTTFAWHTEDMDLYSINYLHFGEPKSWYAIAPKNGARFERVAAGLFPEHYKSCKAFLRHKTSLISPSILKAHSIPYGTITQEPGEFMITFPYSYHAGFNQGFNCAESTNFASKRWVEYGKRCSHCTCMSDSVKISMDVFVRRLQPDRYDLWLQGRDVGEHPENPGHKVPAPPPDGGILRRGSPEKAAVKSKTSKRHPVHKRPAPSPSRGPSPDSSTDSCDDEALPDEQDLAFLEDLYIKGGELGAIRVKIADPRQASVLDDGHGMRHELPGAKKPRADDEVEWLPGSKKSPKKIKCRYPRKNSGNFPVQTVSSSSGGFFGGITSGGRKPMLSATVFPSLSSPSRVAAGTSYFCNEAINRILGKDLSFVPAAPVPALMPQRVFTFNTNPPTWSFQDKPPGKPVSPDSTVSSSVQLELPTKPEDYTPPANIGIEVLQDLIMKTSDKNLERLFNSYWSQKEPCCALCTTLCTRKSNLHEPMPDDWKEYNHTTEKPHSTDVWSPAYVFSRRVKENIVQPSFEFGSLIEKSLLLTCEECRVCVHAFCYGETRPVLPGEPWRCDKCRVNMSEAACCLCAIPWGPLKRTSDRRWAHLLCSLLIYEVNFMDEDRREPINVHNIISERLNLKCSYCKGAGRGVSVECCHPLCRVSFHPTCGLVCGARFSVSKGPHTAHVLASCADHTPCPPKVANSVLKRPAIGETVWARHSNGRYYSGTVECVDEKIFAWIEYADGSFSNETDPQLVDIGPFCRERQLKSGLKVEVFSGNGAIYQGVYEGSSLAPVYTVRTDALLITGVRDSDLIEFGKAGAVLKEENVKQEIPDEPNCTPSSSTSN